MTTADAGTQTDVAMGCLQVFLMVQAMDLRLVTRFRAVSALRPEVVRWGFLLLLSMPWAWRAVAGPVAGATTPVRTTGGSLPQRPAATWC